MSVVISPLGNSSSKVEIPFISEEKIPLLPNDLLCKLCFLQPIDNGFFSTNCRCFQVLSTTQRFNIMINSQEEMNELIKKLNSETLLIDLSVGLTYEACSLDSALLFELGKLLDSKNVSITSLHLYVRYIYNEHKEDDKNWNEVVEGFAQALAKNSTLKNLDLSNFHITFIKDLVVSLQKNTTLTSLNLRGVAIGGYEAQIQAIMLTLEKNAMLESLNLSENYLTSIDLAPTFRKNSRLKELDLSENLISEYGVVGIPKALKESKSLKYLNLAKNKLSPSNVRGIGKVGIEALALALGQNSTLEYLNLSDNDIDASGIVSVSEGLKKNSSLKSLDVSNNYKIGDTGAMAIGESLKTNATLTFLNLSKTETGDQGLKVIAQALESNSSLQILNLSGNSGNGHFSGTVDVEAFITFNKTTGIGTPGAQAMAKALEKNRGFSCWI